MTPGPKRRDRCKQGHDVTKHRYILPNGRSGGCKLCRSESNKKWFAKMYAENPSWQVAKHLRFNWGLTVEQYEEKLKLQNYRCAICRTDNFGRKRADVDHCHRTGKIRGLLCTSCNNGLGRFKDSTDNLEAAIRYLQEYR